MLESKLHCDTCDDDIDISDCYCGYCTDQDEKENIDATITNVALDFLERNKFDDDDHGYADDFPSPEYKEAFLAGVKSASHFTKIKFIVTCLDYGVDLQYLYDKKENKNEL